MAGLDPHVGGGPASPSHKYNCDSNNTLVVETLDIVNVEIVPKLRE
jgi:hypothetical protein